MNSQKVDKFIFPSFRRKPESSIFKQLQNSWTPASAGVTTFYESIDIGYLNFAESRLPRIGRTSPGPAPQVENLAKTKLPGTAARAKRLSIYLARRAGMT